MVVEDSFVVYQSKWKQGQLVLLSVFMLLVSGFIVFYGASLEATTSSERMMKYIMIIVGCIAVLFFGTCSLFIFKQFVSGKKLVVLTPQGFYDHSSMLGTKDKIVDWQNVKEITIHTMVGQRYVSVYLNEPDIVLAGMSRVQLKLIQKNVKMGYGELNINVQTARGCTEEELAAQMNRYRGK